MYCCMNGFYVWIFCICACLLQVYCRLSRNRKRSVNIWIGNQIISLQSSTERTKARSYFVASNCSSILTFKVEENKTTLLDIHSLSCMIANNFYPYIFTKKIISKSFLISINGTGYLVIIVHVIYNRSVFDTMPIQSSGK